jgi:hypothetical protein
MESKAARKATWEMTRAAKITYLVALFIGFSTGAIIKFRATTVALDFNSRIKTFLGSSTLSEFAYFQYAHADPAHATAALQSYADLLEQMTKLTPENGKQRELSFAYTRMALVEDAANNPEQSRNYIMKARYWYQAIGGRPVTESELKAAVRRLDEYGLH